MGLAENRTGSVVMKKKNNILCLSWCDADDVVNYGQILQALAMMRILRDRTDGRVKYISFYPRGVKGIIRYYLHHMDFRNGHLQSYLRTRKTIKKIVKENKIDFFQILGKKVSERFAADVNFMICGSDQIWHPQNYRKEFFLGFGKTDTKRIAFSASLPKTKVEPQFALEFETISKDLKNFDHIAVREEGSAEFISELSGKYVDSVMDPTFLVPKSYWENIIETMDIKESFVFVYIPNGMDEKLVDFVNDIKEQLGVEKVLVVVTRGNNYFVDSLKFVSVGQFLYLIKNARCVITTSFHAVVFSIIFHTDFYCYDVPNEHRGEDIRLSDILSKFSMENRLITDKSCIYTHINFKNSVEIIEKNSRKSLDFLDGALM